VAEGVLGAVLAGAGEVAGVHLGHSSPPGAGPTLLPVPLLRRAGATFVGVGAALLPSADEEALGQALEDGMGLLVAAVPLDDRYAGPRSSIQPVWALWKQLGLALDVLPRQVALTPVPGLEQLSPDRAVAVLRRAVEAARVLEETAGEEAS
jgi:hypothetical protein